MWTMPIPLPMPITPMLAKAAATVPTGDYLYEPKWDGFRCIVVRDGADVQLHSRGSKPLTRYFPEVVRAALRDLPDQSAYDGEIVVRSGADGAERLDWEGLSQRIHPAESRVKLLSEQTPAEVIFFDALVVDGTSLLDEPFVQRRARLEAALRSLPQDSSFHVTRVTNNPEQALEWFTRFEGAGLDGVVAKATDSPYTPGKRTMIKIKHSRTADVVLVGYRIHKSGNGVGSLLVGLYDDEGHLFNVGGISAFTAKRRLELIDELAPFVVTDDDGHTVTGETDRSRFSANKDVSFVRLRPERVIEVKFDQLEGRRFRHAVGFLRWRPDREPSSCLIDQVERAPAYDLGNVIQD